MKKSRNPIRDIWWGTVLGGCCGIWCSLDVTRKSCIELLEQRERRPWKDLRKAGWRTVKLQVRELSRS